MITCLVTDRRRLAPGEGEDAARECLMRQVLHAVEGGIDLIQVRERDLEARALVETVSGIVQRTRGSRTRVVVNDRLDVALAAAADGVHLRRDSMAARDVRRLAPAGFLIGRSVGSIEQAQAADGADYLIAGTVWPSGSKPQDHQCLGIAGFAAVAAAVRVPVLAIGGVTVERASAVAAAGGRGIAAIGAFMAGEETKGCRAISVGDIVHQLHRSFDTSRSRS